MPLRDTTLVGVHGCMPSWIRPVFEGDDPEAFAGM